MGVANTQFDPSPLVPMSEYSENYRTLNGWECFEARGKLCHDKDHKSMVAVTGSSNSGHAVCCKPDYSGEHCNSDTDHRCSQPVGEDFTSEEFDDVLTDGLNHQMFAFLPKITPERCGISDSTAEDVDGSMKITAGKDTQKISLLGPQALLYRNGKPAVRRYDACYYEISTIVNDYLADSDEDKEKMKIIINISKLKNMNAYVYEGMDRYSATKDVNGNRLLEAE